MIDDFKMQIEQGMQNIERKENHRPTAVWVFGVLNIVLGCYSLEKAIIFWPRFIRWMMSRPDDITSWSLIMALYSFVIGPVFAVLWIVLGIGLLKMKRWARRGSILLGILFITLTIYTVIAMIVFMSRLNLPEISWWTIIFSRENASMLIGLVYIVLLILFMRSAKVKEAFRAMNHL